MLRSHSSSRTIRSQGRIGSIGFGNGGGSSFKVALRK